MYGLRSCVIRSVIWQTAKPPRTEHGSRVDRSSGTRLGTEQWGFAPDWDIVPAPRPRFHRSPLLHPAAALHQGGLLEPLKEDFKKLKEFLDRHTKPAEPTDTETPATPMLQIESPQPAQMDLFGS